MRWRRTKDSEATQGGQDEEPQQVARKQVLGVGGELLVAHVGGIRKAEHEREGPEGGQAAGDDEHRDRPLPPASVKSEGGRHQGQDGEGQGHVPTHQADEVAEQGGDGEAAEDPRRPPDVVGALLTDEGQDQGADDGEQGREQVAEPGHRQGDGRPGPVFSRVHAAGDQPEEEQGGGQADREGELAGEGGGDVAAVDRELPGEQIRQGGGGQAGGPGKGHSGQLAESPGGDRQEDQAGHRDQLERHRVGEHDVHGDDHEHRKGEVVDEGGEPAVPVRRPSGQPEVGQQVIAQIGREPHVGAHVPAGGRRRREQVGRLQLDEDEHHGDDDDDQGDERLGPAQPAESAPPPIPAESARIVGIGRDG